MTEAKVIAPQRIPGSDNLADLLTKALPMASFNRLVGNFVQVNEEQKTPGGAEFERVE